MKIVRMLVAVLMIATCLLCTVSFSASAATFEGDGGQNDAIFVPSSPSERDWDPKYNLYSDKEGLYDSNGVLRGCRGWTRLTDRQTGSDQIYHYTNASVEDAGGNEFYSGRKWGYGKVTAQTLMYYNKVIWYIWVYYGY